MAHQVPDECGFTGAAPLTNWQARSEFRYEQAARNLDFAAKAKRLHGQLLANEKRFADAERLLQASLQLKQADDVQQLLDYVKSAKARAASKAKQQAGK